MHNAAHLHRRRGRQRGAVIVTVALLMLFLLGFIGIALDFGRLFVVKTELQTAMDGCALAGAQELDQQNDSITRARSAGLTAGNLNRVDLQSASWGGLGQIVGAEITFRDADYATTTLPEQARYVECQHTQAGVPLWLIQALGAFSGNTALYPSTQDVGARAVATRGSAQTTCPLPVAMKPKAGGAAPNYGFVVGEWVTMITDQSDFSGGQIGWMSLVEGENGSNAIREQLNGYCGTRITDRLEPSDSGNKAALVPVWNYRFGLYSSPPDYELEPFKRPDLTGYSYTTANSSGQDVYDDFSARRQANEACAATVRDCEDLGFSFPGNIRHIAPSGDGPGGHGTDGTNRRLVIVPVVEATNRVDSFVCMLMLQPLSIPMDTVQLEFRGNASDPTSPCATPGLPGGAAGPLVPVLVR